MSNWVWMSLFLGFEAILKLALNAEISLHCLSLCGNLSDLFVLLEQGGCPKIFHIFTFTKSGRWTVGLVTEACFKALRDSVVRKPGRNGTLQRTVWGNEEDLELIWIGMCSRWHYCPSVLCTGCWNHQCIGCRLVCSGTWDFLRKVRSVWQRLRQRKDEWPHMLMKLMKVSLVLWGSLWAPWLGGGFPVQRGVPGRSLFEGDFSPAAGGGASAVLLEQRIHHEPHQW